MVDLAYHAAKDCLTRATAWSASDVGLLIVSSGSAERRFPGPAKPETAARLGLETQRARDRSSYGQRGFHFWIDAVAAQLSPVHGQVWRDCCGENVGGDCAPAPWIATPRFCSETAQAPTWFTLPKVARKFSIFAFTLTALSRTL